MFKSTWDYLQKSELSIGVNEGFSVWNNTNYLTSNYGDGIPLYLNFPEELIKSIKKAGISLVTSVNNHLLDKGINGALRVFAKYSWTFWLKDILFKFYYQYKLFLIKL
jgi:hypothetical protein